MISAHASGKHFSQARAAWWRLVRLHIERLALAKLAGVFGRDTPAAALQQHRQLDGVAGPRRASQGHS